MQMLLFHALPQGGRANVFISRPPPGGGVKMLLFHALPFYFIFLLEGGRGVSCCSCIIFNIHIVFNVYLLNKNPTTFYTKEFTKT